MNVRWTDKNGESQTAVIETQNRLLGKRCMYGGSIRIAEVISRGKQKEEPVSAAPKPMTFSPNPCGGLNYVSEETAGNTAEKKPAVCIFRCCICSNPISACAMTNRLCSRSRMHSAKYIRIHFSRICAAKGDIIYTGRKITAASPATGFTVSVTAETATEVSVDIHSFTLYFPG